MEAKYGDGFLVYLTESGVHRADPQYGNSIHYGDEVHLPPERMGCSVDRLHQALFYTATTDSPLRWTIWRFNFLLNPSSASPHIKVADVKTSRQQIRSIAVNDHTRDIFVVVPQLPSTLWVLKLTDYDVPGQTISRQDHSFATPLESTLSGGSLVLFEKKLFILHSDADGKPRISYIENVDNPTDWKILPKFPGPIPADAKLGDMIGSEVDSKLYVTVDVGVWMGSLYIFDAKGEKDPIVYTERIHRFGDQNRPSLLSLGDIEGIFSSCNVPETLSKGYEMLTCHYTGPCEESNKVIVAPSDGPIGPVCWSPPIHEVTDAPDTGPPTPSPPTLVPPDTVSPPTIQPSVAPGETAVPIAATVPPESPAPTAIPTEAPPTGVPAVPCSEMTTRDGCTARIGCDWISDVERKVLGETVDDTDPTSPFYRGVCTEWGERCGSVDERGCQVIKSCFWTGTTCLVSSYCNRIEGRAKCGEDPTQCKWDETAHYCATAVEEAEPTEDNTLMLLYIVLACVGFVCLCASCIGFCLFRAKKVGDEFDGRTVREKWFKEADKEEMQKKKEEEQQKETEEEARDAAAKKARESQIAKHQRVLNNFDLNEAHHLQRDDVYTPPPPEVESDDSDIAADYTDTTKVFHRKKDDEFELDKDDEEIVARTKKELRLMAAIQKKRTDIEKEQAKPVEKKEDRREAALLHNRSFASQLESEGTGGNSFHRNSMVLDPLLESSQEGTSLPPMSPKARKVAGSPNMSSRGKPGGGGGSGGGGGGEISLIHDDSLYSSPHHSQVTIIEPGDLRASPIGSDASPAYAAIGGASPSSRHQSRRVCAEVEGAVQVEHAFSI